MGEKLPLAFEYAGEGGDVMSRATAIGILNRLGDEYGQDEIEEMMSGDAWYPESETEWAHYLRG